METSNSFVCLPLLWLLQPKAMLHNGNPTCSSSPPHRHIEVSCRTIHKFLNVINEVSPIRILRLKIEPIIFSSISLQSLETLQQAAEKLLSDWKIPGFLHPLLMRKILSAVSQSINQPDPPSDHDQGHGVLPLLRFHIRVYKFYPQDMKLFSRWTSRGHEEHEQCIRLGMVGASTSSIKSLKRKRTTRDDDDQADDSNNGDSSCAICLDDFLPESQVTCMPCSHGFHERCIIRWLYRSHYCPLCRFELPPDNLSEQKHRLIRYFAEVVRVSAENLNSQRNYIQI